MQRENEKLSLMILSYAKCICGRKSQTGKARVLLGFPVLLQVHGECPAISHSFIKLKGQ